MDGANRKTQTVIVQVKGGHVSVNQIRDLRGVIEREKPAMGFFVCLEPPTGPMKTEAVGAGVYSSELWGRTFPRLQIRTVEELLAGKAFEYPSHAAASWKQAAKANKPSTQQAMDL